MHRAAFYLGFLPESLIDVRIEPYVNHFAFGRLTHPLHDTTQTVILSREIYFRSDWPRT